MTPTPVNPKVVILVSADYGGFVTVKAAASNIDPELEVVVVHSEEAYNEAIKGVPFDSTHPNPQTQVLAARH